MEVCEEDDASVLPKLNEEASCLDDKDRTNSNSNVERNSSQLSDGNSMDTISHSCVDKNLLLSVFEGNAENLEYYRQLRDVASRWDEKEQGPMICDPRDLRKVEQTENWRPRSKMEDLKDLLKRYKAEDLKFPTKQIAVELDAEDYLTSGGDSSSKASQDGKDQSKSFHCGVHGCGEVFTSLALYEAHYRRCHSYACSTCRRSFVSNFLLDVHVQENHDSYFQILSSRIDMYRCLVETCSLKFRTADLRKDHMITEHKFPSNFSFHRPLKEVNSSSTPMASDENEMDVTASNTEDNSGGDHQPKSRTEKATKKGRQEKNTKAKNNFNPGVPTTICFGRGSQRAFQRRGRGGRGRHWHQTARPDADTTVDIESVDMKDLAESLS